MIDFVRRFFAPSSSSATAKERLRLVLMTDHLSLAPELIEQLKRDLVDVISRYVEVDRDRIDVNFEQQDRSLAMLANIPILSVNRPQPSEKPASVAAPSSVAPVSVAPHADALPRRKRRRKSSATSAAH